MLRTLTNVSLALASLMSLSACMTAPEEKFQLAIDHAKAAKPSKEWRCVATGLSGDGKTVVGYMTNEYPIRNSSQFKPFTWHNGVIQILDVSRYSRGKVGAASYDGSVVVGQVYPSKSNQMAAKWVNGEVKILEGYNDWDYSVATDVSSDGNAITVNAGTSGVKGFSQAFVSNNGNPAKITGLPAISSFADAISNDGLTVVGTVTDKQQSVHSYRYSKDGINNLGLDPKWSKIDSVTSDGLMVAGFVGSNRHSVFVQKAGQKPTLYPVGRSGYPIGAKLSGDGKKLFLSFSGGKIVMMQEGFKWKMFDLYGTLSLMKLPMKDWKLRTVNAVSDDGGVIVGNGTYKGKPASWVVQLPWKDNGSYQGYDIRLVC